MRQRIRLSISFFFSRQTKRSSCAGRQRFQAPEEIKRQASEKKPNASERKGTDYASNITRARELCYMTINKRPWESEQATTSPSFVKHHEPARNMYFVTTAQITEISYYVRSTTTATENIYLDQCSSITCYRCRYLGCFPRL